MSDLKYWVAFSKTGIIGAVRFKKLAAHFSDMRAAWEADAQELKMAGIEENVVADLMEKRKKINPCRAYEEMAKEEISAITIKDKRYPVLLKEIYDAPAVIFYKGNIEVLGEPSVGVVGSRKISLYAQQTTPFIVKELAKNGVVIVSGLALGVDTFAHQATVEVGGKTVAVLGGGLDKKNFYPPHNRDLAEKIIKTGGAVISEHSVGAPPLNFNFPQRNRIISGLSLGIIVIEAAERSGALITAKTALDQNREVFAVPGNIFQMNSFGANDLIKKGAHLVTSAGDIMEILEFKKVAVFAENKKIIPENPDEEKILAVLSSDPMHIDAICRAVNMEASALNSLLMMMEMKGMVKNFGGSMYVTQK
ncbi:MAG: DNA-processing protein DprA [bacterium]